MPLPTLPTGALAAGTLLDNGRYQILRSVKTGGMGALYLAQDSRLADEDCAVKELILSPQQTPQERAESDAWFSREARLLAGLRHPLIPRISNHFAEGGRRYLVMDFIQGEDLEQALAAEGGPFPIDQVLNWAGILGEGLGFLHRQNPPVIFRDLKPANIMLTMQGELMLVDFGIARMLRTGGGSGPLSAVTVIGTPGYSPPEQYQGLAEPRSDQFALAATLHHLLTYRDPQHEAPFLFPPVRQLNPGVPPHVEAALTRALSMTMRDRYPSMQEFLSALGVAPSRAGSLSGLAAHATITGAGIGPGMTRVDVIRVAPDGTGDVRTLEEAVQRAAPGATIRLVAGLHRLSTSMTLGQAVTLVGEGRDSTRVVCDAAGYVLRCAGPGPVELHDLTLAHVGSIAANVVEVHGGIVEFTDCRCTGAVKDARGGCGHGMEFLGSSSGRVFRCEIIANASVGIIVSGQAEHLLVENTSTGNEAGIFVTGQARSTLEGNSCLDNTRIGIVIYGTVAGIARLNTCAGNETGISVCGEARLTLEGNCCRDNTGPGIVYAETAGGIARNNTCSGCGDGIIVSGQAQPLLEGNICRDNTRTGISYYDIAGGIARLNSCTGSASGISVAEQAQPNLESNSCRENTLTGLLYSDAAAGIARLNTCDACATGILVRGQARPTLEGNICRGIKHSGIQYSGAAAGIARLNTCSACATGIAVAGQAQPTLEGNSCRNNRDGVVYLQQGGGIARGNDCRDNGKRGIASASSGRPRLERNLT